MSHAAPGDRYSIEELVTLYIIEPTIRDVFVEGNSDALAFDWYLSSKDISASVFAIDDRVIVPPELVEKNGRSNGTRGRALALAIELQSQLPDGMKSATIVVDRDFDDASALLAVAKCVLATDYPSLENYAFEPMPLEKLLRLCLRIPTDVDVETVYAAILPALTDLFLIRKTLRQFDIGLVADPRQACSLESGKSFANIAELVRTSCDNSGFSQGPNQVQLKAAIENERALCAPSLMYARGHDIAPVLSKYLGVSGPLKNSDALERAAFGCLEISQLDDHSLFQNLVSRLAS